MLMSPDFKELLKLFERDNIRYLILGGYAVLYARFLLPPLLAPPVLGKHHSITPGLKLPGQPLGPVQVLL